MLALLFLDSEQIRSVHKTWHLRALCDHEPAA